MHKRWYLALMAVFLLVTLSSCMPTEEREPDPTNTPTFTPTNTYTPTPTNTTTSTPTPTATEIPLPDISGISLYAVNVMSNGLMQISFDNFPPFDISQLDFFVEDEIYECGFLFADKFPERLYCRGKAFPEGTTVTAKIFATGTDNLIWDGDVFIPSKYSSSSKGGSPGCGECECTETTWNEGGWECWRIVCVDSCGNLCTFGQTCGGN